MDSLCKPLSPLPPSERSQGKTWIDPRRLAERARRAGTGLGGELSGRPGRGAVEGKISGVLPDGSWSMTAPIAAGSSGGPVFSRSGGVIGVARGLVENSENYLMLPIAWARGLIAKAPKARLRRAGSSTFTKVLVGAVG